MHNVPIYGNERVDDLLTHDLRIIQSDEVFSFSMDAVLLARFAAVPKYGKVLDLCSGNGVIPLLLSTRTKAAIEGIEIQPRVADMARRSVEMNGLTERILIREGDLRELVNITGHGVYDAITVNPPYMPLTGGDLKLNKHQAIARHEIHCSLEDVAVAAMRLVRPGGKVSMVHKPQRLAEIVTVLRQHRLEPKLVRFVHPRAGAEANMVLIEALRDGKPDVRILPPLIVYGEDGQYCPEIMDIYYGPKEGRP
ncbi:tRNA1(Val) (adenine(37)-N6)-methyltransferase [Paenibacillus macerans]|uniref:Methyltransferase n=1 Tax=Paenibacillus macerans TaxID=44252 RepID=A0A090XWA8_PAEMA|nr:tRNA1(Val) (adenine(37)-N6)-methyltransferase [Paenibacillus macerans]KFM89827.1 methyltransferase small domain protein [Paenibacillus macerans]MBS5910852.1 tRNA1(Val) (adenine(37)-N6)-methyltransferase [Paenibacillus macerans]MCY7560008.1 tRNA1(Val) (adenine(37)-N6)-methyltransferase [Paenibacillus macerans]MDU5945782.1 tRNA1(Val) (adenine(37)-N6)-methyltransferase [Paenibacillus macerans]MEC0138015.1 tRNA1(Val) (adenine(37)-N6)-methyltransferase [Paenibacillus macerans]